MRDPQTLVESVKKRWNGLFELWVTMYVFFWVSVAVMKYHDQKKLDEEKVCFTLFTFIIKGSRTGTWR